jgi:uncharacterized protein YdaU (DUF1376 family)
MKRHIPYFDFYPADFMNGVRGLSPQEVGVYTMILCRIYEESGPVEYHLIKLSTYCGMRPSSFEKVIKKLIELGKFTLCEGVLSNRRAETEIQNRSDKLKINKKAGEASAKKRKENQQENPTDVEHTFNQAEAEAEADKTTLSSVVNARAADCDFDRLQEKLISAVGDNGIQSHGAIVVGPIAELIAAGINLELDIIPTLRSVSSRRTRPASSWAYFIPAIREAYERRIGAAKGLPKPKPLENTDDAWSKRLDFARQRKIWSTVELGPLPGQPGCLVPTKLLIASDGVGWTDIADNRRTAA